MAAGQEIALEPALALVLAQHLHHPPVGGEVVVPREGLRGPGAVGDLERVLPAIRVVLVRAEEPEVSGLHVELHRVPEEPAHDPGRLGHEGARCLHRHGVVAEIRQAQVPEEQPAVGVRAGAHAAGAAGGQVGQLGPEAAAVVEELPRLVALHPLLEKGHVGRVLVHLSHRYLVRAPVVLGALAVDLLRARPALGRAQHDHGPAGTPRETVSLRVGLDLLDLRDHRVERGRHLLVHLTGLVPFDEMGGIAVPAEEVIQLLVADPGQDAGIGDLVAVQVEDRQHHPVGHRVQEFVGVPARRQRPRLRLAVAHDTGDDQVGVVESRPVRVRDGVSQLTPLVNRAGSLRGHVARNAAGKRELGEEALHALLVLGDARIDLAVRRLEVGVRDQPGPPMPGPGDVDHVEVVLLDHPVQVGVDEVQSGRGPPVAEEPRLDVLLGQRLLEQRVVVEVDLADRQVVGGPPVRVHECLFLGRQRIRHDLLLWSRIALCAGGRPCVSVVVPLAAMRRTAGTRPCSLHLVGVRPETGSSVTLGSVVQGLLARFQIRVLPTPR